jgi:hypothetical protein
MDDRYRIHPKISVSRRSSEPLARTIFRPGALNDLDYRGAGGDTLIAEFGCVFVHLGMPQHYLAHSLPGTRDKPPIGGLHWMLAYLLLVPSRQSAPFPMAASGASKVLHGFGSTADGILRASN